MALVKTTGRVGDETFPLVCSNVGPGGAYFSSRVAIAPNQRLQVALRAPGHNAPIIDLTAEVMWSSPPGGSQPAGVAVRWLRAESTSGAEPLRALLHGLLRMHDLGELEATTTRTVAFDFNRHHDAIAAKSSASARAVAATMRPMVVPKMAVAMPEPPPPSVAVDATRLDRIVPDETDFERRAAARRGSGLRAFPAMTPISGPYDALPERSQRQTSAGTPPLLERLATPRHAPSAPTPQPQRPHDQTPPLRAAPRPPSQPVPHPDPVSASLAFSPQARAPNTSRSGIIAPPSATLRRPEAGPTSQVSSSLGGFTLPRVTPVATSDEARSWPMGVPRVLAERYANLTLLGQGGHGVVFRARDLLLDRLVVLKFLAGTGMAPEQARRYFLREFKVAADLFHANIVRLYDIGSADGTLYYTMEHVPGHPLGHYLGKNQPLEDHAFVYSVFRQLASALDYAHKQGVLHRDVKPNNVLVADDGSVRLFDFGLARLLADGGRDQSMVVGTPFYMAPEMQKTSPIDHRADQYALGVVLYRMLTGRVPFADGNVFLAHAIAPVPDPRVFHAELPAAVSPILMKMLAKEPGGRYDSCGAAAAELAPVLNPGTASA